MRIGVPLERSYFFNACENMSLQGLVVAIVAGKALVFLDSFGVGPVAMVDRISAALRKDQLSRPDLSSVPPLDDVRRGEQRDNLRALL